MLAKSISKQPDASEVLRRAAISRAYYAMFHKLALIATEKFQYEDYGIRGKPQHGTLPANLRRKAGDMYFQEVADLLIELRESREYSDYKLGKNDVKTMLERSVENCEKINELISKSSL